MQKKQKTPHISRKCGISAEVPGSGARASAPSPGVPAANKWTSSRPSIMQMVLMMGFCSVVPKALRALANRKSATRHEHAGQRQRVLDFFMLPGAPAEVADSAEVDSVWRKKPRLPDGLQVNRTGFQEWVVFYDGTPLPRSCVPEMASSCKRSQRWW